MTEIWHRFVSGETAINGLDPVIHRSWLRCREKKVNFMLIENNHILPIPALRERREGNEDLLRAARPVIPYLLRSLKNRDYIVLLCDSEGYILESLGDPPFMGKAEQVCLSPGANWKEEVKGTNAIGTALAEQRPVRVLGQEHFVRENHFLNCWAGPIRNPRGEIVGILDVSGQHGNRDEGLIELVMMGIKMIEQNMLLAELSLDNMFYREGLERVSGLLREGLITIDKDGLVTSINRAGENVLGVKKEEVIGKHAAEVFKRGGIFFAGQAMPLTEKTPSVFSSLCTMTGDDGRLVGMLATLQPGQPSKVQWVGKSTLSEKVLQKTRKAALTDATVLISGESGTGKEIIARMLHEQSARKEGPFVPVNCASIPAGLIESELFGYVDGAFTGARRKGQSGKFEQADGGTIFLDEIGDMPPAVQAALLRVLQEREVCRLGDTRQRKIDIRVIAATNQNLKELVQKGLFRMDLYYRLKVISINVPPLRERPEDILDLVPYFLETACKAAGQPIPGISAEVYDRLFSYHWPGNVRELQNCVESMVAMAEGPVLTLDDLPWEIREGCDNYNTSSSSLMDEKTRQAILTALSQTKGKVAPAARILGMARSTLYRKMAELNIR